MTHRRIHDFIVLWIVQPDAEVVDVDQSLGAVLQQRLGSERLQIVASAAAADFIQQVVRRLDVGVRVLVLEVVEDQSSPALLPHVGQHLSERVLKLLREQLSPAIISLLGLGSGLALVDVVEPFLEENGLLDRRVALEQGLQAELVTDAKALWTRTKQPDLVLELDALLVVNLGLDALPDLGDGKVGVAQDVELVDDDARALEVGFVERLVGPVHVLSNHLDLHAVAVLPLPEVFLKVRLLSRDENVEQNALLDIADDEARMSAENLLVHAENAGQIEGVVLQSPRSLFFEHAANKALLHAVDLTAHGELHGNAVLGELAQEAARHSSLLVDVRQLLKKHRPAASAPVPLAGDAQVGFLALERVIPEVDHALAVLHNIRFITVAFLNDRIGDDRVDVQLPVKLFGLHGHVAIQPQKIKSNNAPHAHPRFRRGHYRDRVTSQLMVAA